MRTLAARVEDVLGWSMDPRFHELAAVLTGFSTSLQAGDHVLIDGFDVPDEMVVALVRAARARGAIPHVQIHRARVSREIIREASEEQVALAAEVELGRMRKMQAYIALRGAHNIFENSDVPADKMKLYSRLTRPVQDHRVKHTKWVVLRWPTAAMAQQAMTSTEEFEDFYFRVCTLDYARMEPGMAKLVERMKRTDKVEITGPGTDLRFSIRDIGVVPCGGRRNIPDGEVFTAPVRDSVEGVITYNAPTVYQGVSFDGVRFEFAQGKIVKATCAGGPEDKLNAFLDADEGARHIGEFALGFNPHILRPMRDILFDEKIAGSFHFTPGQAYAEADNGNRSQVHWDIVNIQRPEYGGGEIRFDGEVIRRDGLFVVPDLEMLNPEYLIATR